MMVIIVMEMDVLVHVLSNLDTPVHESLVYVMFVVRNDY